MSGLSCGAPSTSGRCCDLGSARHAGGRLQLLAAGQRSPRAGRAAVAPRAAGIGRQNSLRNKYKSRQQLEKEYMEDWTATTVTSTEEGRRPMTPLTLAASLPGLLRFHIVPAPLRFAVWLVWYALQLARERLRKWAVLALTGWEAATLRRRGGAAAASYSMRAAALRRWHGKESLLQPLQTVLGR